MSFRIAACQMNSRGDKAENLRRAEALIDEAARLGANWVALPEMFPVYGRGEDIYAGQEPIPGPISELLAAKAREHGIYVHGGSMPERLPDGDKMGNTTLVFDPKGEIIGLYRKIHLFDIDITGHASDNESSRYVRGQERVTLETEHGCFGLTICYDIRFPELFRALTFAGARVIFLPAAFTLFTGKDHWETLIRARAIENQVYMVCPAQFGSHGPEMRTFGSAMIVDPWGTVLARAPEREGVIIADIDYAYQDKIRKQLPALQHRRVEVYGGD